MFVGLSKRLKSMGGFRLGVGLRLTKSNCLYFLFVLLFVGCFYLCWYSVLACGWILYFLLYGLYKIYYLMFKYGATMTSTLERSKAFRQYSAIRPHWTASVVLPYEYVFAV